MLPLFTDLPAVSPPGTRYQYNDANFILAGLVIEQVTGRAFADVVADEVIRPACMADTGFEALDLEPARLATGYTASGSAIFRPRRAASGSVADDRPVTCIQLGQSPAPAGGCEGLLLAWTGIAVGPRERRITRNAERRVALFIAFVANERLRGTHRLRRREFEIDSRAHQVVRARMCPQLTRGEAP